MKILQSYEEGYKEQQVAIKETAQQLVSEAITARLAAGKITANDLALYGAIMDEAESAVDYAQKRYAEEKEGKK